MELLEYGGSGRRSFVIIQREMKEWAGRNVERNYYG
jgi:hypothetical protein